MTNHRHQRHDSGAAADKQHRTAVLATPDEVSADRAAHLERIAASCHLVEIRRNLAVLEALDREFEVLGAGPRGDRIAALGLVAVGRSQPDIDVLSGAMSQ